MVSVKFHKNDEVIVTVGRQKGKKGKIDKVFPDIGKVRIVGINTYKRHPKSHAKQSGGAVEVAKPLPIANVALFCPKCGQATRAGWRFEKGKKLRVCRKCQGSF
ncbi:50S ribosomal protein L24 [Candidatus Daviesbacteria bacterium]|nr:50S ribosomal protein L24 [Candidatus Daviesbacteria bacterium]